VVVWLSNEFISKPYPMEELHLLLEWQRQGSPAKLLPVFYGLTYNVLKEKIDEYKVSAFGTQEQQRTQPWAKDVEELRQWLKDLEELLTITGHRKDQVLSTPVFALVAGAYCTAAHCMSYFPICVLTESIHFLSDTASMQD
jgi:hypothetical protein